MLPSKDTPACLITPRAPKSVKLALIWVMPPGKHSINYSSQECRSVSGCSMLGTPLSPVKLYRSF